MCLAQVDFELVQTNYVLLIWPHSRFQVQQDNQMDTPRQTKGPNRARDTKRGQTQNTRSEEHTSELQSR